MSDGKDDTADDPRAEAFLREVARIDDLPPPTGELPPGARLGRFSIVRRLGAGAMGAVYEAKDETLGRSVAIKLMRRTSDEARRRFVQEARAAAAVSHPNLITVHEVGEADGRAFIVMEHIRGETLRAYLAGKPPKADAQRIMRDIARGVAAAHAAGIVHRDLKPDNVMIAADGTVKVVDFGIARVASGSGDGGALAVTDMAMTGTGAIVGTPSYMSPEQAMGREVDARSDVYSFGVVAYELLTGTRPGPDPKPPAVSPQLDSVVTRCLAARRDERFADAGEVRDALDGIIPPLVRSARRGGRSIIAIAAIASLLLLVAGSALAVWRKKHGRGKQQRPDVAATTSRRGLPLGPADSARSSNTEAMAAYKGAFQLMRDGLYVEAEQSFERAATLDPSFAAAQLRTGLNKRTFFDPGDARPFFQRAIALRESLDERDRALLDAAEPSVMREPYDHAESKRRYLAALERFPDDAEIMYWLMWAHSELGDFDELQALLDRMEKIDPTANFLWAARTMGRLYLGDRAGAREAAIECRRTAPNPSSCMQELRRVLDDMGACDELETALRAWMISSPDNPFPIRDLASLLLAQERPTEAALDLLARSREMWPENERERPLAEDDITLAYYRGDFTALEARIKTQPWNPYYDALLVKSGFETGRPEVERAAAENFFAHRDTLPPDTGSSDGNLFWDQTGVMIAALARTGAITAAEAKTRHDAWVAGLEQHIGGFYKKMIWAQADATPARTAEEAQAAAARMSADPPPYYWFTRVYGDVGRTLQLAGKNDEALPYLERATKRCISRDPIDFLYLGRAREAKGDKPGACQAYATVIRRWGNAKPRSRSAEQARERHTALSCEPSTPPPQ